MRRYASAGRVLTQPVRWNSTTSATETAPKFEPELEPPPTAAPASPSLFPVPHLGGPPFARRSFRPRLDDSSAYRPDISAIAATAAEGSLSSRLARQTLQRAMAAESAVSPSPTDDKLEPESPDALLARQREFLQSRRAGWVAGDGTFAASPGQMNASPTPLAPTEDPQAVARRRELLLARREERLARERAAGPRQYSLPRTPGSQTRTPGSQSRNARPAFESERSTPMILGGPAAREGRTSDSSNRGSRGRAGMNMRGSARGGRGAARGGRDGPRGPRPRRDDEEGGQGMSGDQMFPSEIDEWLDSEDSVQIASLVGPEIPKSLNQVLHSGFGENLDTSKSDARTLREAQGGDYTLFVPRNPQHFVSAARKLGPSRHSSVALTHNKQLPAGRRVQVKELVGSVVKLS
ncbi:hypothetical protein DFH07DRAFT_822237 [Mycena maculata]|uniref:Uncharacterized protein n=1 Tax=Mycena maculata TaxID=230809 RepID=A0AAD7J3A1_9AGAR|nr:hypothetical protein DFH07DRAFT_822237 [Mycena maculata]